MRPNKNNGEFFSHDCDMRNDPRILAVRRHYGHEGYSIWCMLLEFLTDREYFYVNIDEANIEIMSGDFGIDTARFVEIVEYLKKIGLLQHYEKMVWCEKLIERLAPLLAKRRYMREKREYLNTQNNDSVEPLPVCGTQTLSKGKESKGKESKGKKKKNISPKGDIVETPASTPPTTQCKVPPCPHTEIIEAYHEILPACPRISKIGDVYNWRDTRQTNLRARWREDFSRQNVEWWQGLFTYIRDSCPFLIGKIHAKDKKPFLADLGWIVKPSNFIKIIEGKYE